MLVELGAVAIVELVVLSTALVATVTFCGNFTGFAYCFWGVVVVMLCGGG